MKRLATAMGGLAAAALLVVTSPVEAQGPYELNIGSLAPKGTPWYRLLQKAEKQIEEGSQGRINVILRPPGQMSEVEMVRETRRGERLQGCAVTTAALAEGGNIPQLQLVELPYLFNSSAEADHILDNVLWEPTSEILARRGFVMGVWSENGWRSFATRGKAIRTPDDLKGYKMRSQESDVHMAMYNAFGANAVQKPMTEVLTALNSNVVDGLDNTALYIKTGGLSEPLEYFTKTNHIYQPALITYSKRWYDELPEDLQAVVMAPRSLAASGRAEIREEDEAITMLLAEDLEVVELSTDEREAFATTARAIHAGFAAEIDGGTELLGKINTALAEYRSK
ncbi:MAG: TRAP transporter substrate-binding protein [Proteobacteria bacterium]|nr:TRAP transporter substrate-binding protein [Pseudomonadota bacterium]